MATRGSAHAATGQEKKREKLTAVGFEPTQLALVELESTPLDHSGKLSLLCAEDAGGHYLSYTFAPKASARTSWASFPQKPHYGQIFEGSDSSGI